MKYLIPLFLLTGCETIGHVVSVPAELAQTFHENDNAYESYHPTDTKCNQ